MICARPPVARPSSESSSPRLNADALGGALHLDEPRLVAGLAEHHHVHVDLGGAVLDVRQVEHGHALRRCRR